MNRYDSLAIRCPRLGHEVAFAYCRRESGRLPCSRTLECWTPFFPVEAFLRQTLSPQEWEAFRNVAPRDKVATLLDLIEAAKKRQEGA